jgi:hypothetical protein
VQRGAVPNVPTEIWTQLRDGKEAIVASSSRTRLARSQITLAWINPTSVVEEDEVQAIVQCVQRHSCQSARRPLRAAKVEAMCRPAGCTMFPVSEVKNGVIEMELRILVVACLVPVFGCLVLGQQATEPSPRASERIKGSQARVVDAAQKAGYTYTFLSDTKAELIRRYHLLHPGAGVNGQDVARPAEFLLDSSGVIRRWANLTEDYRVRARPEQIIEQAKALP